MFGCTLFLIIHDFSLAIQSQRQLITNVNLSTKRVCCLQLLVFLITRNKSHWPLLHFGTGDSRIFPRVAATMSSTKVLHKWLNKVSLCYNVYMVQREIFLQIGNLQLHMYAALYTGKRSLCKNVNFCSVSLTFHYSSYFNASLSTLYFVNLFCI